MIIDGGGLARPLTFREKLVYRLKRARNWLRLHWARLRMQPALLHYRRTGDIARLIDWVKRDGHSREAIYAICGWAEDVLPGHYPAAFELLEALPDAGYDVALSTVNALRDAANGLVLDHPFPDSEEGADTSSGRRASGEPASEPFPSPLAEDGSGASWCQLWRDHPDLLVRIFRLYLRDREQVGGAGFVSSDFQPSFLWYVATSPAAADTQRVRAYFEKAQGFGRHKACILSARPARFPGLLETLMEQVREDGLHRRSPHLTELIEDVSVAHLETLEEATLIEFLSWPDRQVREAMMLRMGDLDRPHPTPMAAGRTVV